jgi:hypothetical protein
MTAPHRPKTIGEPGDNGFPMFDEPIGLRMSAAGFEWAELDPAILAHPSTLL